MSKLFVFIFIFIFIFLVEVNQFAAASNLPSQLNCTVTRNEDGSFTYTLIPAPTVTNRSFSSWANGTDHVFVADRNYSTELVLNITEDSLTLKRCEETMVFKNDGETEQKARCDVNCSLYATVPPPPPSANHIFCLSDHWCPPDWAVVVLVLALVVFLVLVWCKMKGPRCRGRRSKKGKEIYKIVKDGDPAGVSEVIIEL